MRYSIRLIMGVLLVLGALLSARPAAAIQPPSPPPFEVAVESLRSAATDGYFAVWVDNPSGGDGSFRLQARGRAGGAPRLISDKLGFPYYNAPLAPSYSVSDGKLLWIDTSLTTLGLDPAAKLMLTDLYNGQSQQIAQGRVIFPSLDGDVVTWWEVDDAGVRHLKWRHLGWSQETDDLAQLSGSFFGTFISKTSGDWAVWASADSRSSSNGQQCWSLYVLLLHGVGAPEPQMIDTAECTYKPQFDLVGDTLAYVRIDGLLHVTDLRSGETRTSGPHKSYSLSTNGRYVFWEKKGELWGFDPQSESAFLIRQDDDLGYELSARDNGLLWTQNNTLLLIDILDALPVSPHPPAAGRRHFPETNHTLGGEFLAYWSRNGGLPVFGYPLTEEFMQENASDGRGYTVQYLERQRYELHPENAGTPYIVQLGRLGAETLAARGVDWQSLPKASPSAPHYYSQTGQAIDPLFWDYWRSHGLELGDAGVSEREALALWGYPLTGLVDERLAGSEVVKVQWYERARLEYHPDNPEPYKVLLGRLAADTVDGMFK